MATDTRARRDMTEFDAAARVASAYAPRRREGRDDLAEQREDERKANPTSRSLTKPPEPRRRIGRRDRGGIAQPCTRSEATLSRRTAYSCSCSTAVAFGAQARTLFAHLFGAHVDPSAVLCECRECAAH